MMHDSRSCMQLRSFVRRFAQKTISLTLLSIIPILPLAKPVESPAIEIREYREIMESEEESKGHQVEQEKELRYNPTQEERKLLARAVYSEARGESFSGQVAVAAVILNRLEHRKFPDSIYGVIFQSKAFTSVKDGQFWLEPDEKSYRAVEEALKGADPSGGALYYYNPQRATSQWIFTRTVITIIGRHNFAI